VIHDTLLEQLSDPSPEVRETVCWALGQLGYKEAVRRLIRILKSDPSEFVRSSAADALSQIGDPAAVHALIGAMEDQELLVRIVTVAALARLKDSRAVDPLKRALDVDDNSPIRELVLKALQQITGLAHQYLTAEERKIAKYQVEVDSHPESGPAHYNLAVAFYHNGQYKEARYHSEQARALGMGVGWLKRRLEEVPTEHSATDLASPPEQGPEPEAERSLREERGDDGESDDGACEIDLCRDEPPPVSGPGDSSESEP